MCFEIRSQGKCNRQVNVARIFPSLKKKSNNNISACRRSLWFLRRAGTAVGFLAHFPFLGHFLSCFRSRNSSSLFLVCRSQSCPPPNAHTCTLVNAKEHRHL
ncbi:hypothetical protein, unlikely [Trypanosoma brucei gambiense DAL972]|uniref:Uncharacterized protein n=1 Tax=Trypanosoma brucei gambiense (strain MHOM/CI/86/DAL972) TaxID=679716 RepID=C9ZW00_TRYB9|nr:hypothetical protein, unlikely [Trypanosoma brucei gambiense DAL972]CBH13588.1 hypothetical protein, unlikely [Trypanosoma brucei gambiense DAL972]|eukprot:XP_011775865.1 hypothetical protein, unlikely [Trypanosoma brucei gambiense DAL972]